MCHRDLGCICYEPDWEAMTPRERLEHLTRHYGPLGVRLHLGEWDRIILLQAVREVDDQALEAVLAALLSANVRGPRPMIAGCHLGIVVGRAVHWVTADRELQEGIAAVMVEIVAGAEPAGVACAGSMEACAYAVAAAVESFAWACLPEAQTRQRLQDAARAAAPAESAVPQEVDG